LHKIYRKSISINLFIIMSINFKNYSKYYNLVIICSLAFNFMACDDKKDAPTGTNFDRKVMLQNYAENLIVPAFVDLQTKTNALQVAINNFTQSSDSKNLLTAQTAWETAYTNWQSANAYNFGAAGEDGIRKILVEEIGTFPVSTDKIENNITANNNTLADFSRDNRGFLAIEYLLFDLEGDNTKVLKNFSSPNRKNYLLAVSNKIKTQVDAVVTSWNGTYKADFINNSGKESGSSTSNLYNEFIKSYESIKNYKLSLPLGTRPGQIKNEPTKVEAYYSGKSLSMMREHFMNIENIWYGKGKNGTNTLSNIGFKQYLESVEGGKALVASTEIQLAVVKKALAALPESPRFSQQLDTNKAAVENLNTEMQKLTRFFKSDMSSLLGISITFMSSDGD
jgi:predicted lipoprotein